MTFLRLSSGAVQLYLRQPKRLIRDNMAPNVCNTLFRTLCDAPSSEIPKNKPLEWDRRIRILPEVSIRYMDSESYKKTYEGNLVWKLFRRGRPGHIMPIKTRVTCIDESGWLRTRNACPICRDKYLVLDYRNTKLIGQFIDPYTGEIYPMTVINLCQMRYEELQVAVYKARLYGTIKFPVPHREYQYEDYYQDAAKNITYFNLEDYLRENSK